MDSLVDNPPIAAAPKATTIETIRAIQSLKHDPFAPE